VTETPCLDKILRLARPYQRQEQGRLERVRGYISPAKWKAGQLEWEQHGEAGAAADRAADKAARVISAVPAGHGLHLPGSKDPWRTVKPIPSSGRKWGVKAVTGHVDSPQQLAAEAAVGRDVPFSPGELVYVMINGERTQGTVKHLLDGGMVRVDVRAGVIDLPASQVEAWRPGLRAHHRLHNPFTM
jgi:hypothetical protein